MKTKTQYTTELSFDRVFGVHLGNGDGGKKWTISAYNKSTKEEAELLVFETVKRIYNELTEEFKKKLIEN